MYLFSYILFLLFNEFWSCFTGTVFPCFRFPGGGPCLPSAYEKQLTPRIDQWLRVEQTGKLKRPVFFVLQNLFQLAIGMIFYSKLIVSIRWFQFSWFGKWLLHQTSNSILGFFRGSRYSTMRIETVEHDLFWVWDIHLKRTGPEEHGFVWWKKIEEPNRGTRTMFVNKSVLFRIFLGSPGKVPQQVEFFFSAGDHWLWHLSPKHWRGDLRTWCRNCSWTWMVNVVCQWNSLHSTGATRKAIRRFNPWYFENDTPEKLGLPIFAMLQMKYQEKGSWTWKRPSIEQPRQLLHSIVWIANGRRANSEPPGNAKVKDYSKGHCDIRNSFAGMISIYIYTCFFFKFILMRGVQHNIGRKFW